MQSKTASQLHQDFLEAERLRSDPAFAGALIAMRKEALETLVSIDATSTEEIREAQANVRAIDGLTTRIANAILRWRALPDAEKRTVTE